MPRPRQKQVASGIQERLLSPSPLAALMLQAFRGPFLFFGHRRGCTGKGFSHLILQSGDIDFKIPAATDRKNRSPSPPGPRTIG